MASRRRTDPEDERPRRRRPSTPEGREQRLGDLAMAAIEQRIREGTASAQELVFAAKEVTSRSQLEKVKLDYDNRLTLVRIEATESAKRTEEMYAEALIALRGYSGQDVEEDDEA